MASGDTSECCTPYTFTFFRVSSKNTVRNIYGALNKRAQQFFERRVTEEVLISNNTQQGAAKSRQFKVKRLNVLFSRQRCEQPLSYNIGCGMPIHHFDRSNKCLWLLRLSWQNERQFLSTGLRMRGRPPSLDTPSFRLGGNFIIIRATT